LIELFPEKLGQGLGHQKALLGSFQLNGHTLVGFPPQAQKLEPPAAVLLSVPWKITAQ